MKNGMKTICCALLLLAAHAVANDAAISGEGGRMARLDRENTSIQMVREKIVMDFPPSKNEEYIVTADFVFRNQGAATTVTMGFPEGGGGDISSKWFEHRSGFQTFSTWVDGFRAHAQRLPVKISKSSGGYQTHWVKRVRFGKGQTRRVRVRYRSEQGGISNGTRFATYDFTGGNWKGEVEESTLLVKFRRAGAWWLDNPRAAAGKAKNPVTQRSGNRLFYRWRHWQAQGNFFLNYFSTLPGSLFQAASRGEVSREDAKSNIIENPPLRWNAEINIPSPVVVRGGVAFISWRDLQRWFEQYARRKPRVEKTKATLRLVWNKKERRAILYVHNRVFAFRTGDATMHVDGNHNIALPAKPFVLAFRSEYLLYVPLRPLVEELGGQLKTDVRRHRFWFDVAAL